MTLHDLLSTEAERAPRLDLDSRDLWGRAHGDLAPSRSATGRGWWVGAGAAAVVLATVIAVMTLRPGTPSAVDPAPLAEPSSTTTPAASDSPLDTTRLPEATLPGIAGSSGTSLSLARLRGPAVVTLWGSWCEPCRDQQQRLSTLSQQYGPTLRVITVAVRDQRSSAERALGGERPASTGPGTVEHYVLDDRTLRRTAWSDLQALPATLAVDAEGRIVGSLTGEQTLAELSGLADAAGANAANTATS